MRAAIAAYGGDRLLITSEEACDETYHRRVQTKTGLFGNVLSILDLSHPSVTLDPFAVHPPDYQ